MQKFKPNKKNILKITTIILILLILIAVFLMPTKIITTSTFDSLVQTNSIAQAQIDDDMLVIKTIHGKNYKILTSLINIQKLSEQIPISKSYNIDFIDIAFLIFIAIVSILLLRSTMSILNFKTQSKAQIINENRDFNFGRIINSKERFNNVAGIDEVKNELYEIVDFLKEPKKYIDFGVKMPKGILLIGPPGVGKTLIAKAVAGEAGVPFFYQNGSSFVEIYVGVGAKRVRELFAVARANKPSIVFIDEIDSIGKSRGGNSNEEREAALNQLLTEIDGFEDSSGVIVIAATNRAEMIDEALLRSGRFDRRIFLSLPNLNERMEILKTYLNNKKHNVDVMQISKLTVGFSGAALATLVNEAGLHAIKNKRQLIVFEDFNATINRVIDGKKRTLSLTPKEQQIQASYQAAKAYIAYWLDINFERISLIDERFSLIESEIESKTSLTNRIKTLMAGNTWLNIEYGDSYSNFAQDLKKAEAIANKMIYEYGMDDDLRIGDNIVIEVLSKSKNELYQTLNNNKDQIRKIAQHLLENESINKSQIKQIIDNFYY